MTTKRNLRIPKGATDDEIVDVVGRHLRAGMRRTLQEQRGDWAPLWVRRIGDQGYQVERAYGGDAIKAEVFLILSDLPADMRPLVQRLLDLLDEQAWMARVAQMVSAEFVERDTKVAGTSKAGGDATAERYARPELDDLISGCLQRGDPLCVEAWVEEFGLSRSAIYRRITRIKAS